MALIKCIECGREISSTSPTCPGCGAPVRGKSSLGSAVLVLIVIGVAIALVYTFAQKTSTSAGGSSASQPEAPAAQQSLEAELTQLHDQYREASRQRNRMNEDAIEGQMRAWKGGLKASPVEVTDWVCGIKTVDSDQKLTCTSGIVVYHVKLAQPESSVLSALGAGRQITVTGKATEESSITSGGALNEPEITIDDASVVTH